MPKKGEKVTDIVLLEKMRWAGITQGSIRGRETKEKGIGIFAPGVQEKAAALGSAEVTKHKLGLHDSDITDFGRHTRWHVNRGKVNPDCRFCQSKEEPQFRRKRR